jgi:hypothetical protein
VPLSALGGLVFGYDLAGAGATFVMDGFQESTLAGIAPPTRQYGLYCTPATEGKNDRDKGLMNGWFGVGATLGAIMNP